MATPEVLTGQVGRLSLRTSIRGAVHASEGNLVRASVVVLLQPSRPAPPGSPAGSLGARDYGRALQGCGLDRTPPRPA